MNLANFFVVADTHFYKNSLGAYGKYYDKFMRFEQKCFAETQSINEALFEFLKKQIRRKTFFLREICPLTEKKKATCAS